MSSQNINNSGLRVVINNSKVKTSADPSFGNLVKQNLASTAGAISSVAAPLAPTANAVISAAVNNAGAGGGTVMAGATATGGAALSAGTTGTAGGWTATGNAGLDGQAKLMEMSQSFNMQYLALQQNMQDENRRFTTISNVMKTKHDTAKNAISNLK